jgi:effector-binding domain-containing protein
MQASDSTETREGTVLEVVEAEKVVEIGEIVDKVFEKEEEETKICVQPVMEEVVEDKNEEENLMMSFKSICNFVKALNEVFGERCPSLQLYSHLLEKTGLIHEEPIKRHIGLFRNFCKENELFIINKDYVSFKSMSTMRATIQYSDKVFIPMKTVFELADKEELETIYVHLLTISAVVVPNSKAKKVLKNLKKSSSSSSSAEGKGGGNPTEFLANIFKKISENVNMDASNPMEMMTSLMSSGVLTDIMGMFNDSMGEGSMDLTKLMSTLMSMMSMFSGANGGGVGGGNGEGPDLSSLMEIMKQMGNNNNNNNNNTPSSTTNETDSSTLS